MGVRRKRRATLPFELLSVSLLTDSNLLIEPIGEVIGLTATHARQRHNRDRYAYDLIIILQKPIKGQSLFCA
ncbi:MAG: hypothetical protein ACI92G_002642 [Candidatus Pelagisphaera sp.]|jgi:hypothetical protein